ncbi:MAG: sulfurtransferase [Micavibrio sp.]|nr:sulfurtransferase [Micavibrio sp.]
MTSALISPEDLLKKLDSVKLIDASWGLTNSNVRIGNAVDFDIDEIADLDAQFTHAIPAPEFFAACVSAMGISNGDHVVVYDRMGMAMAASRVWWMFRLYGHDNVQVLDGGLPAWVRGGHPLQSKSERDIAPGTFTSRFRPEMHKTGADVLANLQSKTFLMLDARDAKRYAGEAPEPRPGMQGGHIPGAISTPFQNLIDPATGKFKTGAALHAELAHVDTSQRVAISCGSGVTACVVALALHEMGKGDAAIYGGSWQEWGGNPALPRTQGMKP